MGTTDRTVNSLCRRRATESSLRPEKSSCTGAASGPRLSLGACSGRPEANQSEAARYVRRYVICAAAATTAATTAASLAATTTATPEAHAAAAVATAAAELGSLASDQSRQQRESLAWSAPNAKKAKDRAADNSHNELLLCTYATGFRSCYLCLPRVPNRAASSENTEATHRLAHAGAWLELAMCSLRERHMGIGEEKEPPKDQPCTRTR